MKITTLKTIVGNSSGMTLIEMIVYVALFGMIFATIVVFATTISNYNQDARDMTTTGKQILFIDEHLADSINKTSSINEDASVWKQDNGDLQLLGTIDTYRYVVENGSLVFYRNADRHLLTNPNIRVSRFFLEDVRDEENAIIGVRVEMRLFIKGNSDESLTRQALYMLKSTI